MFFLSPFFVLVSCFLKKKDIFSFQVNHSETYVDPITGSCTNTIEAKWGALKKKIPRRCRGKNRLPYYLTEQLWRSQNKGKLWEGFLRAFKEIVYLDDAATINREIQESDEETESDQSTESNQSTE